MKTVIVFLADGFEECEALASIDLMRRAGINVITASIMGRLEVMASHKVQITADVLAENADYDSADMVVLPGGGLGTQNLSKSDIVKEQCLKFADGKMVAAICAAPTILAGLGLLEGRSATCYPGLESRMHGAVMVPEKAVTDGNIITGQAAGAAYVFALELIKALLGSEAAEKTAADIVL